MGLELATIFRLLLVCGSIAAGTAGDGRRRERRILAEAQPAELPCTAPGAARGDWKELKWTFVPSGSGSGGRTQLAGCQRGAEPLPRSTKPICGFKDGYYSLLFSPAWEDGGEYRCEVSQRGQGSDEEEGSEQTYDVQLLRVTTPDTHPAVGSSVTLQCEVSGSSAGIWFEWSFNRTAITVNKTNRIISRDNRTLTLLKIRFEDSGRYVCRAEARRPPVAPGSAAITLQVTGSNPPSKGAATTPSISGSTRPSKGAATLTSISAGVTEGRRGNLSTPPPPEESKGLLLVYILVPVALVLLALVLLGWFLVPGLTRAKADTTRLVEAVTGEHGHADAAPQGTKGDEGIAYATICMKDTPPVHRGSTQAAETTEYATVRI